MSTNQSQLATAALETLHGARGLPPAEATAKLLPGRFSGEPFVTMPVGRGIVSSATIQRMECPGISNAWRLRQSFRADGANRSKLPETLFIEAKRLMPKFAIGDLVDKDKTHSGTVIAVFTTIEGEQRYAVDLDGYGALQFIMECNLVPHETPQ
jgi:hypothetical protein